MKDLSESLWRRRQSGEREPELYSIAFPRQAIRQQYGEWPERDDSGFTPFAAAEPISDDEREMHAEVALLGCPPCTGNCAQSRTCPARTRINDEPLFHAADLYIAAIAVAVIGGVVVGWI